MATIFFPPLDPFLGGNALSPDGSVSAPATPADPSLIPQSSYGPSGPTRTSFGVASTRTSFGRIPTRSEFVPRPIKTSFGGPSLSTSYASGPPMRPAFRVAPQQAAPTPEQLLAAIRARTGMTAGAQPMTWQSVAPNSPQAAQAARLKAVLASGPNAASPLAWQAALRAIAGQPVNAMVGPIAPMPAVAPPPSISQSVNAFSIMASNAAGSPPAPWTPGAPVGGQGGSDV